MASANTFSSDQLMNNQIETFIEFLLDTETTSEESFSQAIQQKDDLYQECYQSNFETIVNLKLQEWENFYQKGENTIADRITMDEENEVLYNDSDWESEEESLSNNEKESSYDSETEQKMQQLTFHQKKQRFQPVEQSDIYTDPVGQCRRLLQFLYHCQQHYNHLADLYFHILDRCVKYKNENISNIGLQQIARHLSNDKKDLERLKKLLPLNLLSSKISALHKPILSTIESIVSTDEDITKSMSSNDLDILYPFRARFLDLRREFRDSTHYFIDGDSLILSVAHHINIDLLSYYGNTLHVIFIIERILLTLSNQAHQCNYTLVFFDCHYQFYRQEKSILTLLRACVVNHFSKNIMDQKSLKVQQFSSWLDDGYTKYAAEEKPHFIFYHDMSSFDTCSNRLLSKDALEKLLCFYRLFGNYHQYYLQCHVYLMNRLILTNITVKGFQIKFMNKCSRNSLNKAIGEVQIYDNNAAIEEDDWIDLERSIYKKIDEVDIRLFIYLKTIFKFINEEKDKDLFELFSPLLILHVVLLIRLSLVDRHLPLNFPLIEFSSTISELMTAFQQRLALILSSYPLTLSWFKIADIFDGRLFAFTLYRLNQSTSKIYFDCDTMNIVNKCLSLLKLSNNKNLFPKIMEKLIESKHIIVSSLPSADESIAAEEQKITKISNSFIDTLLRPILQTSDRITYQFVEPEETHLIRYEGRYHWHVYKEVGNEIERIRNNDELYQNSTSYHKRIRNIQKFYTYFSLYGRSLTSRDVKDNQLQITLPTSAKPSTTNEAPAGLNSLSRIKNMTRSSSQPRKIDIYRAENGKTKHDQRTAAENDQLTQVEKLLKSIPSDDYAKLIDTIDKSLPHFQIQSNRLQLFKWKFRPQRKYLQILKKKRDLTAEEKSKLDLLLIGYFATMSEIVSLKNVFERKRKYMEELVTDSSSDTEKWYRFQVEKINSQLPRREQGVRDRRALDFIPDSWQVEFLDAVDQKQSIIIVAPTASGKTYASYYAMRKTLEDPNGICVYIAPSKALVNQVAATIYSKFGPIFGIFTRDYRMNLNGCRILITVPQCMEILLLSINHQEWCQRIKYAIFDEIHCMSGEMGADVWEKTMLLINCPMIGLSATVNNGEELRQWIQHVEDRRSQLFQTSHPRQVRLIVHHERMADLNKYLYSNRELHPLHPVGVMNAKQLITRGIPKDFSLSPRETLQLNDAVAKVSANDSIPTLTQYFSPDWIVERSLFNQYSRDVCQRFDALIKRKNISAIDSVTSSLGVMTLNDIHYPESKPTLELIKDFILTLKEKNLLPCIVFSDNRVLCERMAADIAKYFTDLEEHLRQTKYKEKIADLKDRLESIERTRKKGKLNKEKKSGNKRKDDDDNKNNIAELRTKEEEEKNERTFTAWEQQLLDGILDEGTLANRYHCDRQLVDTLLERSAKTSPKLVEYMKRGVAYHHAGLPNKGRVAVEALFRNRYVQVVFSTSTLSMGIHMPTKTVAFVKDSIYLDALQFRQSSGRAGRRGFDIQGHVVFIDIPLTKIRHLIISAIPDIHAHFPTSVTFLMRLLHLCSLAKDSKDAINRSLIALECPFLAQSPLKHHLVDIQTRFHSLFTLDFLYRLNLINKNGELIGLAGLLTHLHYFEPANILLTYLMSSQLFRAMNNQTETVTILAYLFTSMPWLITHQRYEHLSKARKESKYNSKLFLPSISSQCREHVGKYNSIVKEVYGCYIENVTRYLRSIYDEQKEILPFSNISFAQNNSDYDHGSFEYNLHHHQSQQIKNPSISPFAGPSGLTHQCYMSNYNPIVGSWDLVYDLDLSPQIVPFVDIDWRDHTNITYHLNSYVLDFFEHGSEKLIITENGLDAGDTYNLLLDFRLILSSIKTSLEAIVKNENKQGQTQDLSRFEDLHKWISNVESTFSTNFHRQYPSRNQL